MGVPGTQQQSSHSDGCAFEGFCLLGLPPCFLVLGGGSAGGSRVGLDGRGWNPGSTPGSTEYKLGTWGHKPLLLSLFSHPKNKHNTDPNFLPGLG